MSYAHVSSSSLDLIPVSLGRPHAKSAHRLQAKESGSAISPRRVRYQVVGFVENALYLAILLGHAVMVYGLARLLHLGM